MELRGKVVRGRCWRCCERVQLDAVQGVQRAALSQELWVPLWRVWRVDVGIGFGRRLKLRIGVRLGVGVGLGLGLGLRLEHKCRFWLGLATHSFAVATANEVDNFQAWRDCWAVTIARAYTPAIGVAKLVGRV